MQRWLESIQKFESVNITTKDQQHLFNRFIQGKNTGKNSSRAPTSTFSSKHENNPNFSNAHKRSPVNVLQ